MAGADFGQIASQASGQLILWGSVLIGVLIVGVIIWQIMDYLSYNIKVVMLRQIGVTFDHNGKKKLLTTQQDKAGKLYKKKQKSGGSIEYFKIRSTDWNYKNYFHDSAFNPRQVSHFLDFKNKVISVFVDAERGLVPLYLSNPDFALENVTLNEAIGAISDSLHERDNLYASDFWSKYGSAITVAMLITFLVLGMIFVLKYQEVQWDRSMKAMEAMFNAMKNQAAPNLEVIGQ